MQVNKNGFVSSLKAETVKNTHLKRCLYKEKIKSSRCRPLSTFQLCRNYMVLLTGTSTALLCQSELITWCERCSVNPGWPKHHPRLQQKNGEIREGGKTFFTRLNQGTNCQTSALLLLINNDCSNKVQWDKIHAIRKRLLSSSRLLVLLSDPRLKLKDELLDSFGVINPLHHGNGSCCYNSQPNFYRSVNTLETAKLYEQPWFWMGDLNEQPTSQNVKTYSMSSLTGELVQHVASFCCFSILTDCCVFKYCKTRKLFTTSIKVLLRDV